MNQAARAVDRAIAQYPDSPWAERFRIESAKIRLVQGETDQVFPSLTGGWHPPSDPNLVAERLCLLSLAFAKRAEPKNAADAIRQAGRVNGISMATRADIVATRARLAQMDNRLVEAERLFEESAAMAHDGGNRFGEATARLNLGLLKLQQNRYEDAIEQSNATTRIASSIGAEILLEKALGNVGWAYFETGDFQRARQAFSQAAASSKELGVTTDEETWGQNIGLCEARLGNLQAAQQDYERALALARSLGDDIEITDVDEALASLLLRTHQLDLALPRIQEVQALAKKTGASGDIQFGNLLGAQHAARSGNRTTAIAQLLLVEQSAKGMPAIHLEAQHTLASLYAEENNVAETNIWYRHAIATYRVQRADVKSDDLRLPFFANGRDLYMDYVAFLVRSHRAADALAVVDQGRAETLSEGLSLASTPDSQRPAPQRPDAPPRAVPLVQLARQAKADILVYALSPQGSYLWAANGKQSGFYTLPARDAILAAIATHRRNILAARDILREQEPAAHQLYDMLVAPAASLIHRGDRVYIVADDGMHSLNFETLLTPAPPDSPSQSHFWIEDVTITNLSSARPLARPRPSDSNRLLVIGNPVYAGTQFAPLPNAAAEVADVAAHFTADSRAALTGPAATPAAYLASDPARYTYIHFVAHAVASEMVPLDSAVILSPPNSPHAPQNSGRLYARDILGHPLNASLVTISACQGSGARAYAGEGLVGLAWAFLRAGAHNVIGALWDVSDVSTPALMQHLYDGIAAGRPPDTSLRDAKLQMLHGQGVFRKPLYWSALQLYAAGS